MNMLVALLLIHSWYSQTCCGNRDCHPVSCDSITQDYSGDFLWYRGPNDVVVFYRELMRLSEDDSCHVCVPSHAAIGVCIYLAPRA